MKAAFLFLTLFIASSYASADDYGCELKTEFSGPVTGYAMEFRGRDAAVETDEYLCVGYFVSPTASNISITSKLTGESIASGDSKSNLLSVNIYSPKINALEKVSCLCSLR